MESVSTRLDDETYRLIRETADEKVQQRWIEMTEAVEADDFKP